MALLRQASKNPSANDNELILESVGSYIGAIIASNMSDTIETKISVWVEPFEFLPIDEGDEDLYRAYIIKNGVLPPGGSYESWRFAVGVGDRIVVSSNNGRASFSYEAVLQGTT